jgi:hypothetical protein
MKADENLPDDILSIVTQGLRLMEIVMQKSLDRAKLEGLDKDERVTVEGSEFHNKLQEFAMFRLAFYECSQCNLPYYGG